MVCTYDLDIIGHPAEENLFMDCCLPICSTEQRFAFEHRGQLGKPAEKQNRKRRRQVGQVFVEELLQLCPFLFALQNLEYLSADEHTTALS